MRKSIAVFVFFLGLLHSISQEVISSNTTICWDISASMVARDLKKEFSILEKVFERNGNQEVQLLMFGIDVVEKKYIIKEGDWTQLQQDLENVSYDGGTIYNKFSMELRYPITLKQSAKIFALSFVEAGITYNDFKDYNPFNLKRSAGVGLRIFMPAFGLLGIDFGYGFDSVPGQGNQPNGWETHFIIGQQF